MKSYCISYDLCSPGKDYSALYDAIKAYGTWAKVTESFYIVKTSQSATSIRDNLRNCLDSNDRLFVGNLSGEAAWRNVICDNDWLKKYL